MDNHTWDTFYDSVHAVGLDHLALLADAAKRVRSEMADCPAGAESLHYVQHLVQLSHTMLAWSHYLIPKERPPCVPTVRQLSSRMTRTNRGSGPRKEETMVTDIYKKINADSCGDAETMERSVAFLRLALQAAYPEADITIETTCRETGVMPCSITAHTGEQEREAAEFIAATWDEFCGQ